MWPKYIAGVEPQPVAILEDRVMREVSFRKVEVTPADHNSVILKIGSGDAILLDGVTLCRVVNEALSAARGYRSDWP